MAIKQRSVLSTQNTTLSTNKDTAFPDNNNKEITAADLRTWLDELLSQVQDILDSYFNKLDELRITSTLNYDIVATPTDWNGGTAPTTQNLVNDELADRIKTIEVEPNQTAFETPYSPTSVGFDWLPEGDPTEVRGALDILAARTGKNPSNNIAYVSDSGSDTIGEFEIGNPLKPFLTIQVAINALPLSNCKVICLGGSFAAGFSIAAPKSNYSIDLRGTNITGNITLSGVSNITINLEGGRVNGKIDLGAANAQDCSLFGGIVVNPSNVAVNVGDGSVVNGVYIESTNYIFGGALQGNGNETPIKKPFITNCRIFGPAAFAVYRIGNAIIDTCSLLGGAGISSNTVTLFECINCRIESTGGSQNAVAGEGVTRGKFNNCTLISAFNNVRVFGSSQDLNFENCTFIAGKDCLDVSPTITRSGDDTILQNCSFFPAQTNAAGVVLNDASGYGSDTGVFRFIRNTYSKAWSTTDAARAIDYNSTTILGLLPPPIV